MIDVKILKMFFAAFKIVNGRITQTNNGKIGLVHGIPICYQEGKDHPIDHQFNEMKYLLQDILITLILINFAFLYATADYTSYTAAQSNVWDSIWYVLEALIYVVVAIALSELNYKKLYRSCWRTMALFFLIRTIWEVSAVIQGISVNEKIAMAVMFILTFGTILYIAFLPLLKKKWQKRH